MQYDEKRPFIIGWFLINGERHPLASLNKINHEYVFWRTKTTWMEVKKTPCLLFWWPFLVFCCYMIMKHRAHMRKKNAAQSAQKSRWKNVAIGIHHVIHIAFARFGALSTITGWMTCVRYGDWWRRGGALYGPDDDGTMNTIILSSTPYSHSPRTNSCRCQLCQCQFLTLYHTSTADAVSLYVVVARAVWVSLIYLRDFFRSRHTRTTNQKRLCSYNMRTVYK